MAGVHPFIELLRQGADVIIGGRSSDSCVFAAPAIHHGFPESQAYYLGKVLECASFCAEPYGGKETVLGEVTAEDVKVTAMHPEQRCTVASVSGHAMYERSNPYFEHVAGGTLDMSECRYEQVSEKTTRITGARFKPAAEFRVKLEGAGKVGERYVGMVGIRDPYTIAQRRPGDRVGARQGARALRRESGGYELYYTVYGRNGVMGELEPLEGPAGARAVHPGAGRRAERRDGGGSLHDRHAPDVLRAPARREGLGGRRGLRAGRSAAREPGAPLDAQPHACAATIRWSCSRRT